MTILATQKRSNLLSRRTALRSLAAVPLVAAAGIALPRVAGAADGITVIRLDNGGTVELIEPITDDFNGGYVKPDASNTGVKPGTTLTKRTGDVVVTVAGTVIENLDIYGRVLIRAANVVVRNCRVRGTNSPASNTGLIDCNHTNVRNALIEDCLLTPDKATLWLDGVIGKEYTARRCHVYNTVDGFGVYNATDRAAPVNVKIESCYVHDLSWYAKDPNHSNGPSHNDGIQVQGGSNVVIRGNNIQGYFSKTAGDQNYPSNKLVQGVLIQPNLAPINNSDISYNWFDGTKVCVYFAKGSKMGGNFGTVSGNRFGRDQYKYSGGSTYQIRAYSGFAFANALTQNLWDDNDVPCTVSSTGGIRYE